MFVIETPYFNLDQTYLSGQIFRWIRLKSGKYVIPYRNKALKVEQVKSRLILSCNEKEFYDFWFNYFDLATDYRSLNDKLSFYGEYLKICSVRGKGIHIIKQDLFETIVSFIVSQQQSIPRIRAILDKMCAVCGLTHKQSMRECGRVTWYEFPTPEQILENADNLDSCGLGYRKDYVVNVCQSIVDGWLDLDFLKELDYEDAKEYLMQFDGIGPKVADCICLYALHHMQAFPVDTHIKEILKREFDEEDPDVVRDWNFPELVGYEGLVQQYMFYNEINKPMEASNEFGR